MRFMLVAFFCFGALTLRGAYYGPDGREYQTPPQSPPWATGTDNYAAAQWRWAGDQFGEITPYTPPAGLAIIPDTRSLNWDGSAWVETYQTETAVESAARLKAAEDAQLQTLADTPFSENKTVGNKINRIYGLLDDLNVPLPVTSIQDIVDILANDQSPNSAANRKITELMFIFDALHDANPWFRSTENIRRLRAYLVSTNQTQE